MSAVLPRYPVYVPSRGRYRHADALTARFLRADGVPFYLVVEEQERHLYESYVPEERLLVLPESDQGLVYARNWIRDHAEATGAERHWQIDDNIRDIKRAYRGRRIPCDAGPALRAAEDYTDRYSNIGISGLNYQMFGVPGQKPVVRNVHVYSCTLINHAMPARWRLFYNDDTDLCLQALSTGWTTVLINVFLIFKAITMTHRGGNTADYQGDGRLEMARSLERAWPGVARVERRYGRPQHVIDWRKFDTPLLLKPDVDLSALPEHDEYGMKLREREPVRSHTLRAVKDRYAERHDAL